MPGKLKPPPHWCEIKMHTYDVIPAPFLQTNHDQLMGFPKSFHPTPDNAGAYFCFHSSVALSWAWDHVSTAEDSEEWPAV